MRFDKISAFIATAFAAHSLASPLEKRATVQSYSTLASPADGTPMAAGQTFPFNFELSNWCETGYSPFSVYILDSKPTASSMNATQGFTNYLHFYGTYLVDNFPRTSYCLSIRYMRPPTVNYFPYIRRPASDGHSTTDVPDYADTRSSI
jgi:hypothetical protein